MYLNLFRVFCSEHRNSEEKEEQKDEENIPKQIREPFYPHRIGISNVKFNCYMNALFSCLYDIPFFQDTVYRIVEELPQLPAKNNSTLMSLADIFVKMRLGKNAVKMERTMFPAIKKSMNWEVGQYQCVLEFWGSFVETMPERFKELFQVKVNTNYIRKSDDKLIKAIPDVYNYINIPVPSQPISISYIIYNQFLDEEAEDYNIYPEDQEDYRDLFPEPITEKTRIPVKSTVTFTNSPNVLVFGVKRLNYNVQTFELELNSVPVIFDSFALEGERYVLIASVIFNNDHYYAIVKDINFGDAFLHNDTRVSQLKVTDPEESRSITENIMKQSVLFFYVKLSTLEAFKAENLEKIRENLDIAANLLNQHRDQQRQTEEANKQKSTSKKSKPAKKSKKTGKKSEETAENTENVSEEPAEKSFEESAETTRNNENVQEENNEEAHDGIDENVHEEINENAHKEIDDNFHKEINENSPNDHDSSELDSITESSEEANELRPNLIEKGEENTLLNSDEIDVAVLNEEVDNDLDNFSITSSLLDEVMDGNLLFTDHQIQAQIEERKKTAAQMQLIKTQKLMAAEKRKRRSDIILEKRKKVKTTNFSTKKAAIPEYQITKNVVNLTEITDMPLLLQNSGNNQAMGMSNIQQVDENIFQNHNVEYEIYRIKLADPRYSLGTENFTFLASSSPAFPRSYALELVLSAFAFNSTIVKKFFSSAKERETTKFEYLISVVLVQMLVGAKNIQLNNLIYFIRKANGPAFLDKENVDLSAKIVYLLEFFSKNLKGDLMPLATLKSITYADLDTDEPLNVQFVTSSKINVFKVNELIPTRQANISGFCFDQNSSGNRSRSVLTSNGEIFPIAFNRFNPDGSFNESDIYFNNQDYSIVGGIFYGRNEFLYADFVPNYSYNYCFKLGIATGGVFNLLNNEAFQNHRQEMAVNMRKRSLVLFVMKNSSWKFEQICSAEIPLFLARSALGKIKDSIWGSQQPLPQSHSQQPLPQSNIQPPPPQSNSQPPPQQSHSQLPPLNSSPIVRFPVVNNPLTFNFTPVSRSPPQVIVTIDGKEHQIPQEQKHSNVNNFRK